jgi:hypothetical protein
MLFKPLLKCFHLSKRFGALSVSKSGGTAELTVKEIIEILSTVRTKDVELDR